MASVRSTVPNAAPTDSHKLGPGIAQLRSTAVCSAGEAPFAFATFIGVSATVPSTERQRAVGASPPQSIGGGARQCPNCDRLYFYPMTIDKNSCFGPKLDRLLRIREIDSLGALVLPIFPIAPLPAAVINASAEATDPVAAYAASLAQTHPRLSHAVEEVCGPAPWIVRSAGDEDLKDHVNAGGYDSLICLAPEDLTQCVAAVALSGYTEHARRQQALSARGAHSEPITSFVQPLLKIDVADDIGANHTPYLGAPVLSGIEAVCAALMETFDFAAIDCEWGLETTLGFVSMTTIMPRNRRLMNGAHTIGFGFASAQSTGSRATTLALRPASTRLTLWRGHHLRETAVLRLHLLQARPACIESAFRERAALTDECYDALARHYGVVDAALMIFGTRCFGHMLVAPNLMSAWRQFLALDEQERRRVSVVLVDEGSAEEHAGIMFRQEKITCIRMDTRSVPFGVSCVAFDRGKCIFGDSTMLRSVCTELRRELVLPDDCALIFTEEVLDPAGELTRDCARRLSQLRRLPLAKAVKERLLERTEQPTETLWMQRQDGTVESPSLFAQVRRSRYSGRSRALYAVTPFAKAYERADRLSRHDSRFELTTLSTLLPQVRLLGKSGDLRLVMALLECEAALSWAPARTICSLLRSATGHLVRQRRDDAVFVLQSLAFVSAECARLPIYERHEIVSHVSEVARAFEGGLSPEAMSVIHSLGLPLASAVALAGSALRHPAMLVAVKAFGQTAAAFRGFVSAGDGAVQLSQRLNEAYLALRNALYGADLRYVAEQIRASLIETYDASLKGLLARVVESADAAGYQRYLAVMHQWIMLLGEGPQADGDGIVLHRFQVWLRQWSDETMPQSFEIADRNWRHEFEAIASAREAAPRYENPHVVHNLLHQWALAGLRFDTRQLPQRVFALERFCSTFSSRSTKILRFERALLEIQIPMGTHKASYVFTPHQISVEWAEPPDCSDGEIARILAFEVFLDRFRSWMFPGLTFRRERVLGTWSLFIRLGVGESGVWHYDDLKHVITATRFLFDASYDFSYVANDTVDGFAERFAGPQWRSVAAAWVQYRAVLDDASQYVALHALPMSSAVSAVAQSGVVRGLILRCLRRGADYCSALIDRYSYWLERYTGENDRWRERYERLRQTCLFLAAEWPREAVARLVRRHSFNVGDDLVAACLLKRSDLKDELRQTMAGNGSTLSGISGLIVRHAPEIAVAHCGAQALAAQLANTGVRFRRAKHYLIAHFGDRIDPAVLERLLRDMDTVPRGRTAAAEQAIQRQISARDARTCRFELERGVDWTVLDTVGA